MGVLGIRSNEWFSILPPVGRPFLDRLDPRRFHPTLAR